MVIMARGKAYDLVSMNGRVLLPQILGTCVAPSETAAAKIFLRDVVRPMSKTPYLCQYDKKNSKRDGKPATVTLVEKLEDGGYRVEQYTVKAYPVY